MDLNSSIIESLISLPFSFCNDFFSEPRWSIAAAAITPRSFETAFMPASFPGVSFIEVSKTLKVTSDSTMSNLIHHGGTEGTKKVLGFGAFRLWFIRGDTKLDDWNTTAFCSYPIE